MMKRFEKIIVKVNNLIKEMQAGKIGALITYQVNPSYNLHNAKEFNK